LVVLLCFSSYSNAQVTCSTDGTTNPLAGNGTCLDPNDNTVQQIIDQGDFGTGSHNTGSSHNQMYQMTDRRTGAVLSTDYIMHFSYTDDTWITNLAINQALVGAGFDIAGYITEWEWKNETTNTINGACTATKVNGDCLDDLVITVDAFASGTNIYSEEWDYSQTKSNGYTVEEVLSFAPLALVPGVTIDQIEVTIRGKDNGYWQGMHGPKVKNFTGSVVLMPDTCTLNGALSDASCPGYANALFQQQCTSNPLFDPSCSGYAAAYLTQQCSANPLYDPACPGYANAYYNQQCQLNPLYDSGCTGYKTAYYNQQCQLDPLYDSGCTGYKTAYFNQQCSLDPLYDPSCPGYASANLAKQCDYDPLYSVECTGYQQAYLEQQCELDSLYDVQCPDYQTAIELTKIVDNGRTDDPTIINNEIDVTTTTEIEGLPNVLTLPDVQTVVVEEIDDGEGFQEVEDNIRGDQLAMEDDIEKEIEELEGQTGNTAMDDDIEKELAEVENEASSGDGNTNQEDDIEKELAELKENTSEDEDFQDPTKKTVVDKSSEQKIGKKKVVEKKSTKNDKIRMLLAQKAIELTKKIEQETNLENQMLVQRQLLALISYVPGFDYAEKKNKDNDFYPDKPTVDHAFARWFLNDPNFDTMENLQYPNLN